MRILGKHVSHDASACLVKDGKINLFFDHSKIDKRKYGFFDASSEHILARSIDSIPDAWAFSCTGQTRDFPLDYFGLEGVRQNRNIYGKECTEFFVSHELGHIWSAVSLSPYQKCYVMVVEGTIGGIYYFDNGHVTQVAKLPRGVGNKYQALYATGINKQTGMAEGAGKLMALVSGVNLEDLNQDMKTIMHRYLHTSESKSGAFLKPYDALNWLNNSLPSELMRAGFKSKVFLQMCKFFHDIVGACLLDNVNAINVDHLPVVIAGGCGLNCDWNALIAERHETFIPPCPDDSGQSIGAAAYANWVLTGKVNLEYDLFCGFEVFGTTDVPNQQVDLKHIAELLVAGEAVAWIQGKFCMGPRALGDRSLLMSAFREDTQARMNKIKNRESFRPVAPSVLEEDAAKCFNATNYTNPVYMQYFQTVSNPELKGVTHTDGTARAQYANAKTAPSRYLELLRELRDLQGIGIVANSSLNWPGTGMTNNMRSAVDFCKQNKIVHLVVDDKYYFIRG